MLEMKSIIAILSLVFLLAMPFTLFAQKKIKPPVPEFQQNLAIILLDRHEGMQYYSIVDKFNNNVFAIRSVPRTSLKQTLKEINEDYCFWYRMEGFKQLRKYYINLNTNKNENPNRSINQ